MKKIVLCFVLCVSCLVSTGGATVSRTPNRTDSIAILKDSIVKLNKRPVMSSDQFVRLYKYDRLLKYYQICKRKPTQWKYYKGWSIRVFEL